MWSIFIGRSKLWMLSPDFDNADPYWTGHFDALRKGGLSHIGFNCFVRPQFGIGVRVTDGSWTRTSERLPVYFTNSYGALDSTALVDVETSVGLVTVAPAIVLRLSQPTDPAILTVTLSGGIAWYVEEHSLGEERQLFGGESLFASVSAGLDLRLGKYMTLGLNAAYSVSTLDRLKVAAWTDPDQRLLRPEATIGLRRATLGLQLGVVF